MMDIFKKQPKLEIFSLIPEITAIAPILPAKKVRPKLLVNAGVEFANRRQLPDFGLGMEMTTAKCPGIYNLAKHGFIMTTWQDITIETNGDGESFTWSTPTAQETLTNGAEVGGMVGYHSRAQYTDLVGASPNTLANVLRIQTPWRCIVPDGYYLYEGPVPYNNDDRFTTVSGVFSREHGVAQMNVQILWHVMNGKTLIKAGTPIAHYMLIPKDDPTLVVRDATDKERKLTKIHSAYASHSNVANIKETKCFFSNLFKDV